MNISDAAKASGISAKMIRHYEGIGLIRSAHRSDAGYRIYHEQDIHVLRFIRSARNMGFSLDAISELLALWQDKSRHSVDVKKIAQQHIDILQQKISELQDMVSTLQTLMNCCADDQRPDCPILENFAVGVDIKHY